MATPTDALRGSMVFDFQFHFRARPHAELVQHERRLPPNESVEGRSLLPLLKDPAAEWPYPALTTHGANNHAVRGERYRYIRYHDGSEELYDMKEDPNEWHNLAHGPVSDEHRNVMERLAKHLPESNHTPRGAGGAKGK